jgi:hypothetical protein
VCTCVRRSLCALVSEGHCVHLCQKIVVCTFVRRSLCALVPEDRCVHVSEDPCVHLCQKMVVCICVRRSFFGSSNPLVCLHLQQQGKYVWAQNLFLCWWGACVCSAIVDAQQEELTCSFEHKQFCLNLRCCTDRQGTEQHNYSEIILCCYNIQMQVHTIAAHY